MEDAIQEAAEKGEEHGWIWVCRYVDGWGWSLLGLDGGRLEEVRLLILGVVKRKRK